MDRRWWTRNQLNLQSLPLKFSFVSASLITMSVLATLSGKKENEDSIGTPNGHYAPPSDGPFTCMRCTHFTLIAGTPFGTCDHPQLYKDAKAGYLQLSEDDKPIVHHEGCSNFFNNKYINEAH